MTEPIAYHLIRGGSVDTLVAFNPGADAPIVEADSTHPHWQQILRGLDAGDKSVFELFDVQGGLIKRLKQLSDRIEYDGNDILFDGDVVDTALSRQIRRFVEAGSESYYPLVRFWEKIATNPSERSREQLFKWLQTHDFTITDEGDVVGYKAVLEENNNLVSSHSGIAFVNGKYVNGKVRNNPGDVVSIPRAKVNDNPAVGCSHGLHVGDWTYVQEFLAGSSNKVIVEVHFNPRDAVSVPSDSKERKIRVRKYHVIQKIGKHIDSTVRPTGNLKDHSKPWQGDVGYKPEPRGHGVDRFGRPF